MIRRLENAGDRLLRAFVPKVTAKASCVPGQFCRWCRPGAFQRVAVDYDCNEWVISACGDPRCP
jgi:hypothetical protein